MKLQHANEVSITATGRSAHHGGQRDSEKVRRHTRLKWLLSTFSGVSTSSLVLVLES